MSGPKKNNKKHYVLRASSGKYKISLNPITIITEKKQIIKNPKNIVLSIFGIVFCSLIGFVLGGIIGAIVGTLVVIVISVALLFLIGPTEKEIIERNKKKIS